MLRLVDLAGHADGSVMMRMGDTVVLVTAVMGEEKPSMGYFPLSVEFEERHYASGQILGSRFLRREGKPSDNATLSGRVIDRTIRPLFDHSIRNEMQVIATVLAVGMMRQMYSVSSEHHSHSEFQIFHGMDQSALYDLESTLQLNSLW